MGEQCYREYEALVAGTYPRRRLPINTATHILDLLPVVRVDDGPRSARLLRAKGRELDGKDATTVPANAVLGATCLLTALELA